MSWRLFNRYRESPLRAGPFPAFRSFVINPQSFGDSVRLYASTSSWIEGAAVQQLRKSAELPGVVAAIGMPDLHPGKGIPIGAAILTRGLVYPHLVGNDIGCGMALSQTDLGCHKARVDKWIKRLSLDLPWEGDRDGFAAAEGLPAWSDALGTIGGGNHFAELQRVEEVLDAPLAARLGLDPACFQLMVHSGSRGLGEAILRSHTNVYGGEGIPDDTDRAAEYLRRHDDAVIFARANRRLIARRFLDGIGCGGVELCDMTHNLVTPRDGGWLHRKGAAPSDPPFVLIPGSRGTLSYVVHPLRDDAEHGWSLAHGAGRKWDRGSARARLENRYTAENLQKTKLGSRVLCADKDLLFEEAPEAYKDIDRVIADLTGLGLARVVATLRPVLTYKTDGSGRRWN